MRHRKHKKTFDRDIASRDALMRGLATNLFVHGVIIASAEQAKELRGVVERIISLAKKNPAGKRSAEQYLYSESAQKEFTVKWMPVFEKRTSGYTRLTKLMPRKGDGAEQIRIEFVQ